MANNAVREKPILFSAPMVQAIIDGRKTQTRRIVKPQPHAGVRRSPFVPSGIEDGHGREIHPSYRPGDLLWVRESFSGPWSVSALPPSQWPVESPIWYWADGNPPYGDWTRPRPSIFMPRWASRITLQLADVRIERLQDISEEDARAEGASYHNGGGIGHSGWRHDYGDVHVDARSSFARLWRDINGADSWAKSPWVYVLSFTELETAHA